MSEFKKILKKLITRQLLLLPLLLIISIYSLLQPLLYKNIIDDGLNGKNPSNLYKLLIIYFLYFISLNLLQYIQNFILVKLSNKNYKFFNRILFSKLIRIYGSVNRNVGEIQSLLNNDINKILNFSTTTFAHIGNNTIIATFVIIYILKKNYILGLICLSFLIISILVNSFFFALKKKLSKQLRIVWKTRMDYIALMHNSLDFIKANLKSNFFWKKYEVIVNQTNTVSIKHFNTEFSNNKINSIIFFICEVLTLLIIGKGVISGTTAIGTLLSLMAFIPRFFTPAIDAINKATNIGLFIENFNKLDEFYSLKEEEGKEREDNITNIHFNDFCYSYSSGSKQLNYKKNSIKIGKINLIRGANGCGKSTLIKMFLKLLIPPEKSLFINENPIHLIKSDSVRKRTLYLPQNIILFPGTLLDNII